MEIAFWIFGGFAAIVFIVIGIAAYKSFTTPLGEGEGRRGSVDPTAGDLQNHRNNLN